MGGSQLYTPNYTCTIDSEPINTLTIMGVSHRGEINHTLITRDENLPYLRVDPANSGEFEESMVIANNLARNNC